MSEEVFDVLLRSESLKIERIVSKGHVTPEGEWYDQAQSEWVMVLQGAAILEYDTGEQIKLQAGGYLNIPAHARHRVIWTPADCETVWLAVHY